MTRENWLLTASVIWTLMAACAVMLIVFVL